MFLQKQRDDAQQKWGKIMKALHKACFCCALIAGLLTACGGGDSDGSNQGGSSTLPTSTWGSATWNNATWK